VRELVASNREGKGEDRPAGPHCDAAENQQADAVAQCGDHRSGTEEAKDDDQQPALAMHVAETTEESSGYRSGNEEAAQRPSGGRFRSVQLSPDRDQGRDYRRLGHRIGKPGEDEDAQCAIGMDGCCGRLRRHGTPIERREGEGWISGRCSYVCVSGTVALSGRPSYALSRLRAVADQKLSVAPERADARRNRELLLRAAARCVAEKGVAVSALDIAETAGVSVATLYRRFTTKEALIEAVLLTVLVDLNTAGATGLTSRSPWDGLAAFIRTFAQMNKDNQGLSQAIGMRETPALAAALEELRETIRQLVARAQQAGMMREDVSWTDVAFLPKASLIGSACIGLEAGESEWERCLTIMLDGLRSPRPTPLPGNAPRAVH